MYGNLKTQWQRFIFVVLCGFYLTQVQAIAAFSELANVFSKSDFLCLESSSDRGKANAEALQVSENESIIKLE